MRFCFLLFITANIRRYSLLASRLLRAKIIRRTFYMKCVTPSVRCGDGGLTLKPNHVSSSNGDFCFLLQPSAQLSGERKSIFPSAPPSIWLAGHDASNDSGGLYLQELIVI
jgi:hypothetical protein